MPALRPLALSLALCAAGAARANPPLSEVPAITEGLIAAAIAWEIGDKCDDLDARMLRGAAFLSELRDHARSLGYSRDEIDDFIDDEAEKDRLEAVARQRLRDMGGIEGQWDSYCAVGRAEMDAGSQIGRLLR